MAKRGQNEGSIYRRDDGRWVAQVNVGYMDGKRKRKYLYGDTRREVAEQIKAVLRDQQQGLPIAAERQTVAQFFERWLADVAKPSVRPMTYRSYAQIVRLHIVPALGRHQLAQLGPQHVQALLNAKLEAGLSPRTVQYIRAVLRRALGQALKWGLTPRNVAMLVDPPRSVRHEIQPLDPAQAARFLEAARGDRLEALYRVALSLGLRQGEILGLRWADVNLDTAALRVQVQLQRIDKRPQLVELKTRQSRRTIAMPPALVTQLRTHRARQLEERLRLGPAWQDWDLVFTSAIGTPLDPRNLTTRYKALLRRGGLPDIRFHDLRHSCASLLIAQGVPARVVMETLGHSQISLTLNTYTHILSDMQRQAADAMERLFGDAVAGA
jgi:integrase